MHDNLRYYPEQQQKITQLALYRAYETFYRRLGVDAYSCRLPVEQQSRQNAGLQAVSKQTILARALFNTAVDGGMQDDAIQKALMFYDQLKADQLDSSLKNNLAMLLASRGGLLYGWTGQHKLAMQDFARAEALYHQLQAGQLGSPYMGGLAMLLVARGNLLKDTQPKLAMQDFARAEALYHHLKADQSGHPLMECLANLLILRGKQRYKAGQDKFAMQDLSQAEVLYHQLQAKQAGFRYMGGFAELLVALGSLHSNTQYKLAMQYFALAEELYHQLKAKEHGSPYKGSLALLLATRGNLYFKNKEYNFAREDYGCAEELYHQLKAKQAGSPDMGGLATLLVDSGNLYFETEQYDLAREDYGCAEELFHQLQAKQVDSPYMNNLAVLLVRKGNLHFKNEQYNLAKEGYDCAEELYHQLQAKQAGSPYIAELGVLLGIRGMMYFVLDYYGEAKKDWLDVLSLLELSYSYNVVFVQVVVNLSYNFLSLPNADPNDYLPRIVRLIYRYQDQVVGDKSEKFEGTDWWPWLHHVLHKENSPLLLTILAASFARRLQALLSLNLNASVGGGRNLAEWQRLSKQRHLLGLELEGLAQQDNTAYSQRLADYQGLLQALDALRPKLLSSYDLESIALLSTPALQARLAADEAVVVALSLADFGVEGQEAYWLIATAQQVMIVHTPSLDHVASQLTAVVQAQCQQAAAYGRRSHQRLAPNQDAAVQTEALNGAAISFDGLQHILQEHWQTVQIQLNLLDIRRVHVVGYGRLCGLPWQGVAPPELDLRQYPGLYALNQSRTPSYPSVATPLVLMGYDAANEPDRRLYYLPLEMQLIAVIWDAEAVRVIETLSQAPEHSLLLLLGHGDFYDDHGYFCAADGDMEQMQLALHPRKLSMLGASACLLGSAAKINEEPLGFLSLAACRGDVQFSFGAMMLIDDLLATCLSLLFHWEWRASRAPALAMRTALRQLQTGQWPEPAQQLFREHLAAYLPAMLQAMREDERQEDSVLASRIKLRNSHILHHWTRDIDKFDLALAVVNGDCPGNAADAVDTLVRGLVNALCSDKSLFKKSIDQFVRCWIWG